MIRLIQDIAPRKLYNEYQEKNISDQDFVLVFYKNHLWIKKQEKEICFPHYAEVRESLQKNSPIYLFRVNEINYFLVETMEWDRKDGEFVLLPQVRGCRPKEYVFVAATAWHLYMWYRDNRFCGRCGNKTVPDNIERMLSCSHCGNCIYPKIAPAVIVAVTHKEHILLTRYANRAYKKYALVAGFTEIGETVEETVKREVMEEVGLRVKNIQYYKSQPWGFDSNLLLGFFCEVDGDTQIVMDQNELCLATWVHKSQVPDYGEHLSLTHEMMQVFRNS